MLTHDRSQGEEVVFGTGDLRIEIGEGATAEEALAAVPTITEDGLWTIIGICISPNDAGTGVIAVFVYKVFKIQDQLSLSQHLEQ